MMVTGYSLGNSAIAAIGATNSFYSFIINLSWGLNGGHGIVVAQCFGSHDRERLRSSVAAMLVLNVIGAIILTAASLVALRLAMEFLNTPPEIFDQAYSSSSSSATGSSRRSSPTRWPNSSAPSATARPRSGSCLRRVS